MEDEQLATHLSGRHDLAASCLSELAPNLDTESYNTISMGPLGRRPCSQLSVVNQLCMVINCIESWRDELHVHTQSVFSDIADALLILVRVTRPAIAHDQWQHFLCRWRHTLIVAMHIYTQCHNLFA